MPLGEDVDHFLADVLRGDVEAVALQLDEGMRVNAQDERGFTALMLACLGQQKEVVALLLDRGAKLEHKAKNGWTALELARKQGHGGHGAAVIVTLLEDALAERIQARMPNVLRVMSSG